METQDMLAEGSAGPPLRPTACGKNNRLPLLTLCPEPTPVSGIETLKFLLESNDLSGDDLGFILGVNRSMAYRILKGTRNLTAEHIKKLVARFAVSADLFLM